MRLSSLTHPILPLVLFFIDTAQALANEHTLPASHIEAAAHRYLTEQATPLASESGRLEVEVNPLDPRLRLAACQQPLSFSHNPLRPGRTTLKVSCASQDTWSLYLSATLRLMAPVLVTTTGVSKGMVLRIDQLTLVEQDVSALRRGYFSDPAQVTGHEARRSLRAGQVITPTLLRPPLAVRRDDRVTIQAGSDQLSIRTTGTALEDGRQGEQIRVRNDRSGRTIRARVLAPGRVQAGP